MTTRRKFIHSTALGVAAVAAAPAIAVTAVPSATLESVSSPDITAGGKLEAGGIMAGIAREIITPPLGGLFMGYGSDKGSTAVHRRPDSDCISP